MIARVEGVAADGQAARAQDRARVARRDVGTDAHQREVAGAAAEVGDQHQLLVIQARGVAQRRRDWLELEHHLGEARGRQRRAHPIDRARVVGLRARAPVAHGSADDGPARVAHAGGRAQASQELGDQRLERPVLAADHGARERRAGQVRFDRLDQAPLALGLGVAIDRGRAREDRGVGFEEQHRAPGRGGAAASWQLGQPARFRRRRPVPATCWWYRSRCRRTAPRARS